MEGNEIMAAPTKNMTRKDVTLSEQGLHQTRVNSGGIGKETGG